ncbi:MAG: 50S ribosomal protein L29 [Nitrospirae bacterium]|nr:MAG: 50S ribosomal protein L29 [Nitrospirota bacterium]
MDINELRAMDISALQEQLGKVKQELFHLRFQLAMGRVENPMRIRQSKRTVARIKTIIREKELGRE